MRGRRHVGGEGHAPVVTVLLASAKKGKKADESIAAPKGHGPLHPAAFPVQNNRFQGAAGRVHRSPSWTPSQPLRCWWARAMPPLWQYFTRLRKKKPDESIAAPKGHGPRTLRAVSPAKRAFSGTAGRGHDRHRGPHATRRRDGGRRPCPRCGWESCPQTFLQQALTRKSVSALKSKSTALANRC